MKSKIFTTKAVLVIGFLALLFVQTAFLSDQAMAGMFGFFKRYDVHLSPAVHGQVKLDGEPMANLEVYRELFYEKKYMDKTTTDAEGRFHFPEKNIKSRNPGKLFGETHVTQVLTVDHGQDTHLLWRTSTTRIEPSKVITDKLASLNCDLENSEELHHFQMHENPDFTHDVSSICRWDNL